MDRGVPKREATRAEHMPSWLSWWYFEYQLVHLILFPITVFITLALTTALIMIALAKQRRFHQQALDRSQQREANVSRQYTFMLMAAVAIYLITCMLNFLLNVGDFFERYLKLPNWFGNPANISNIRPCDTILTNWNYALNFILYSFVSSKFRYNMRMLTRHGMRRWSDSADTVEDLLSNGGSSTRRVSRNSRNSSGDSRRSEWLQMNGRLGASANNNNNGERARTQTMVSNATMLQHSPSSGENGHVAGGEVVTTPVADEVKFRFTSPHHSVGSGTHMMSPMTLAPPAANGSTLPGKTVASVSDDNNDDTANVAGISSGDGLRQRRVSIVDHVVAVQDKAVLVDSEVLSNGAAHD